MITANDGLTRVALFTALSCFALGIGCGMNQQLCAQIPLLCEHLIRFIGVFFHDCIPAFLLALLCFIECFIVLLPLTLVAIGFLGCRGWRDLDEMFNGAYLSTWCSMVVTFMYLCMSAYGYYCYPGRVHGLPPEPMIMYTPMALFVGIWIVLAWAWRKRWDGKAFALFVLQLYITLCAGLTALIPYVGVI